MLSNSKRKEWIQAKKQGKHPSYSSLYLNNLQGCLQIFQPKLQFCITTRRVLALTTMGKIKNTSILKGSVQVFAPLGIGIF